MSAEKWKVYVHGNSCDVTFEELQEWIIDGRVQPNDKVQKGKLTWTAAKNVPALREACAKSKPPLPPPPMVHSAPMPPMPMPPAPYAPPPEQTIRLGSLPAPPTGIMPPWSQPPRTGYFGPPPVPPTGMMPPVPMGNYQPPQPMPYPPPPYRTGFLQPPMPPPMGITPYMPGLPSVPAPMPGPPAFPPVGQFPPYHPPMPFQPEPILQPGLPAGSHGPKGHFPLQVPGFEGRGLVVVESGFFSGASLLLDGNPPPKRKKPGGLLPRWEYLLRRNDGTEAVAELHKVFVDPIPQVLVDGRKYLVAAPLKWYEWAWCIGPAGLLIAGGAIGGLFFGIASYFNVLIFRSRLDTAAKYLIAGAIAFGALIAYVIVLVLLAQVFPSLIRHK